MVSEPPRAVKGSYALRRKADRLLGSRESPDCAIASTRFVLFHVGQRTHTGVCKDPQAREGGVG